MRTETFAFFFGIAYLSAGLLGLHPAALAPAPADAPPMQFTVLYGYLLGVLPVNLPLSAAHLAVGAWGILAWRRVTDPRVFAGALAVFCGALAVAGLIPRLDTLFGMMPLHGNNVWLHLGTAALAAYFALHAELSVEHRARSTPDRRVQAVAVASERRHGHADRRLPAAGEEI
jgi:hypothetical protein